MDRTKAIAAAALALLLLLTGCTRSERIIVGSKNFTEQLLIGEIVSQHLEARLKDTGVIIERKLNLGGTLVAHTALITGQIDLYPEYTGTAVTSVLKQEPKPQPPAVRAQVKEGYRQWNVEWLKPLGFNNTFAMVVRSELAQMDGITKLSEAASRSWTLGIGYEFLNRADGLAGLQKAYSLQLARSPLTMDLGLLYKALEEGQVDMVAANSTDAQLASDEFTVLEDDRGFFPPYEASLVARAAVLRPEVRQALAELSGVFTDEVMRNLNAEVTLRQRPVVTVAREFLQSRSSAQP
jgi:glycine betaine/choline ABC-type transport system substrate-binding protein